MSVAAPIVATVADQWSLQDAARATTTLDEVLLASRLLGSNRALANFGGGNTSAKGTATDHVGREVAAMWVKGSGSDLATMSATDFTPLRLEEILPLLQRDAMSDEEMVAHLARCQLDPAAPRSSIETLLHAFIPAAHVHHTHPDAINALACAADGQELITECFGDSAAWIPYIRPGFSLAKQVGEAVRANPDLRLVVLAKHGLVVWGDTAREAYEQTVSVCNQAAELVNGRSAQAQRFGGPARDAARRRGPRLDPSPGAPGAARCGVGRPLQGAARRPLHRGVRAGGLAAGPRDRDGGRGLPRPPRAHQAGPDVGRLRPGPG